MKNRFFAIRLINMLIILALIGAYQITATGRADREAEAMAEARASAAEQESAEGPSIYNDGTYTGSAEGYGGLITVEVTIEGDCITEIDPVSHSGEGAAYWDSASDMIPEIIRTQDPNVDTVTGATLSSVGIHNAVTKALQQALR